LNNVTHPWTAMIADQGLKMACETRPTLTAGINCISGRLTCDPVAKAHGMELHDPESLLS
jgi:alanine dehydrogenase